MADAGGAVYLLSSYQSREQRWRGRGGGGEGGWEGEDNRPDKKGTPCSGGNINFYLPATLLHWLGILHTWSIGEEAR